MGTRARFLQKTHLRLNNKSLKGQKFQTCNHLEGTQDLLDISFPNNNYFYVLSLYLFWIHKLHTKKKLNFHLWMNFLFKFATKSVSIVHHENSIKIPPDILI